MYRVRKKAACNCRVLTLITMAVIYWSSAYGQSLYVGNVGK